MSVLLHTYYTYVHHDIDDDSTTYCIGRIDEDGHPVPFAAGAQCPVCYDATGAPYSVEVGESEGEDPDDYRDAFGSSLLSECTYALVLLVVGGRRLLGLEVTDHEYELLKKRFLQAQGRYSDDDLRTVAHDMASDATSRRITDSVITLALAPYTPMA